MEMDADEATDCYLVGLNLEEKEYRQAHAACFMTPLGVEITPEWLLQTAAVADERYKAL